jgi:hypothetical protein
VADVFGGSGVFWGGNGESESLEPACGLLTATLSGVFYLIEGVIPLFLSL